MPVTNVTEGMDKEIREENVDKGIVEKISDTLNGIGNYAIKQVKGVYSR